MEAYISLKVIEWCNAFNFLKRQVPMCMCSSPTVYLNLPKNRKPRPALEPFSNYIFNVQSENNVYDLKALVLSFCHNFIGFLTNDNAANPSCLEMVLAPKSADHQLIQAHTATQTQCKHRSKSLHNGTATH